jgi:type II secretory pathway component PulJ
VITRRARDDAGLTLVELVVAMSLTTVVLAAVGTVFVGALRSLSVVSAKGDLTGTSETAIEIIGGRLRAADYAPPDGANPAAVLEATYSAMTVSTYVYDQPLADYLVTRIASPTNALSLYLQNTKMVPKQVRYAYVANASACGNKSGVTETVTSPRYSPSGAQLFVWDAVDTPIRTRCVLRSTKAPSLTATPAYSLFKYYPDCVSTIEDSSPLSDIGGVAIDLQTTDASNNMVELKSRICLVNVNVVSP